MEKKERKKIPLSIEKQVLKEFNNSCAKCRGNKFQIQIHHIDEAPSNNDPMNLIPLCPNCHFDLHSSTISIDQDKLKLFRKHKDLTILKPQFHPLYNRMIFLNNVNKDSDIKELVENAEELIDFLLTLNKGYFYSKKILKLIRKPSHPSITILGDPDSERLRKIHQKEYDEEYRQKLCKVKAQLFSLIIESLHYQKWQ
jgi:hypothetical protein